ncbi:MAG: amidohydrolase family protein [Trueperaceae bacterium]|nr:amidohydrolase family protein [Trueperaceae bacterium]
MIDAHHHLWRYDERQHDWMTARMGRLKRDHLPDELESLIAAAGVHGTIAVQARRLDKETAWLLELARQHPFILGVVGWLDTAAPDLEASLERLSGDGKLIGMREVVHDMPDPDYCSSTEHVRAVGVVARAGLAYDLLLKPENLASALVLVDTYPECRFVVDHIAKPDMRPSSAGTSAPDRTAWERGLRRLASRPNVACKLSGLVTECDWDDWNASDVQPFLDTVLDAFGASRCMLGSDWPVCTLAADYRETIGLVTDYARRLSDTEQNDIFERTARTWYRLNPSEEDV